LYGLLKYFYLIGHAGTKIYGAGMRNLSYFFSTCVLLAGLGMFSAVAYADQIRLKNGDVITGTVIKKETDKVVFNTAYAGDINILWSEVEGITTDQPLHVMLNDNSSLRTKLRQSEKGKIVIQPTELAANEIPIEELQYINPSPEVSGLGYNWTGRVNLGGTLTDGNTRTQAINLDTESVARSKTNRYTVGAIVNRAESQGIDTQFNSRGYMKYDRFLSQKWYLYANSAFENDKFRDIKLRTSVGLGSGYQLFELPSMNLFIEGGLNYINTNFYVADSERYPAARWSTKYDQLLFGGKNKFFHEHEILASLEDTSDILVFSKTGLRVPLNERLHAAVQYNYDWSKTPAPGRKEADSAFIFSLGYGW
jgi:putative salt-induced outer membrane protein YdiY